jgi:thiol-disulfide isomerase/thioredoxin
MERRTIALIITLVLIAGAIVYLGQFTPEKQGPGIPVTPGNRTGANAQKAQQYEVAREIAKPSGYINGDNITIGALVGRKVILLDFWTYSCINCERTIPYLNMWYAKYHDAGLEIIGVHTPEFQFEHDIANVRQAVQKFGIRYPVVLDNDYATWSAYNNRYWPAHYLIDIDGYIVDTHFGEGEYDTTERKIQELLRERSGALGIAANFSTTVGTPADAVPVDFPRVGSPETYFGADRNEYLANGRQGVTGLQDLQPPAGTVQPDRLYLAGPWNFSNEYAESAGNSTITYRFDAKNVYFVASAPGSLAVTVLLDGKPIAGSAGADVSGGVVTVRDERLYALVQGSDYGEHILELAVPAPGLKAYTFTFG